MATGLIGTSKISNSGVAGTVTGTTLSYTVPASGVLYAVVSVSASVSAAATAINNTVRVRAGNCTCVTDYASQISPIANTAAYSVVLAPGQVWSEYTEIISQNAQSAAFAFLQASVLEVT